MGDADEAEHNNYDHLKDAIKTSPKTKQAPAIGRVCGFSCTWGVTTESHQTDVHQKAVLILIKAGIIWYSP